ncbi:hypothetical protein [Methyloversatilis sp.]|uniref:hypothetical protein n=1 Tax=Methyloversatilis sp. TaxID=2569862 RepID=UPI0027375877|nr:hypothetical protein [Methyloversatilis sp.]MDP3579110.1 hypothetical protein [Methyloversatilis sp.]
MTRKRGAYVRHFAVLPGRARNTVQLQTGHWMALQLLGTPNFKQHHLCELATPAHMVRAMPGTPPNVLRHADALIRVLNVVITRAEQIGRIEVATYEQAAICASAPPVFNALAAASNLDIARAALAVKALQARYIREGQTT